MTFHIGVALNAADGSGIWIYQSNGSGDVWKGVPTPYKGCEVYSNKDNRGPRGVPVNKIIKGPPFSDYRILHLIPKKEVNPLLIGTWKLAGEKSYVGEGSNRIPVKSVNVVNGTITFDASNNFTVADNDPNNPSVDNGTFTTFYNDTYMRFNGVEFYERDPISAQILELSEKKLRLFFILHGNGFTQYSELILDKQ